MEPSRSSRQSRQSNETDSEKSATAREGPEEKRPLRETGALPFVFFTRFFEFEATSYLVPSHAESHSQRKHPNLVPLPSLFFIYFANDGGNKNPEEKKQSRWRTPCD